MVCFEVFTYTGTNANKDLHRTIVLAVQLLHGPVCFLGWVVVEVGTINVCCCVKRHGLEV